MSSFLWNMIFGSTSSLVLPEPSEEFECVESLEVDSVPTPIPGQQETASTADKVSDEPIDEVDEAEEARIAAYVRDYVDNVDGVSYETEVFQFESDVSMFDDDGQDAENGLELEMPVLTSNQQELASSAFVDTNGCEYDSQQAFELYLDSVTADARGQGLGPNAIVKQRHHPLVAPASRNQRRRLNKAKTTAAAVASASSEPTKKLASTLQVKTLAKLVPETFKHDKDHIVVWKEFCRAQVKTHDNALSVLARVRNNQLIYCEPNTVAARYFASVASPDTIGRIQVFAANTLLEAKRLFHETPLPVEFAERMFDSTTLHALEKAPVWTVCLVVAKKVRRHVLEYHNIPLCVLLAHGKDAPTSSITSPSQTKYRLYKQSYRRHSKNMLADKRICDRSNQIAAQVSDE